MPRRLWHGNRVAHRMLRGTSDAIDCNLRLGSLFHFKREPNLDNHTTQDHINAKGLGLSHSVRDMG